MKSIAFGFAILFVAPCSSCQTKPNEENGDTSFRGGSGSIGDSALTAADTNNSIGKNPLNGIVGVLPGEALQEECEVVTKKNGQIVGTERYHLGKKLYLSTSVNVKDGSKVSIRTEVDDNGNVLAEYLDEDGDGRAETIYKYQYNGDGLLVSREEDDDANTIADSKWSASYDGKKKEAEIFRKGVSGKTEWQTNYTYNEDGRLSSSEKDIGGDGTVDERASYHYYDADRTTEEIDYLADGTIDEKREIRTGANGRIVDYKIIKISDGKETVEQEKETTYDEQGRMVTEEYCYEPKTRSKYYYNQDGGLRSRVEEYSLDNDCRGDKCNWMKYGEVDYKGKCLLPLKELEREKE